MPQIQQVSNTQATLVPNLQGVASSKRVNITLHQSTLSQHAQNANANDTTTPATAAKERTQNTQAKKESSSIGTKIPDCFKWLVDIFIYLITFRCIFAKKTEPKADDKPKISDQNAKPVAEDEKPASKSRREGEPAVVQASSPKAEDQKPASKSRREGEPAIVQASSPKAEDQKLAYKPRKEGEPGPAQGSSPVNGNKAKEGEQDTTKPPSPLQLPVAAPVDIKPAVDAPAVQGEGQVQPQQKAAS
jgi:hypothetical protein